MTTREECRALDEADVLAPFREDFILDDSLIYLDGNSLGPLSHSSQSRVRHALDVQWGEGLVRSWGSAGWMDQPQRLGDRVARLIGAGPGEVVVADTLTFLLAKLLGTALELRPDRSVIVTDHVNFHSDLYIAEGMARLSPRPVQVRAIDRDHLDDFLTEDVAVVMLTHVDFRTGEMLDLSGITRRVHNAGAIMIWDFAHSTGAVPLDATGADVDFAAGCTYKYVNAGPGGPGFAYVAPRWQSEIRNVLPGWLGHVAPFDFEDTFRPAPGVRQLVTSSPSVLALAALEGALDVWDRVDMNDVRRKSLALTDLFIELVEARLPGEFGLATPREHSRRGSQVALRHAEGYGMMQALAEVGVIGDFRDPDICRFGFAPLYVRFVDVFDAVERLVGVIERGEHRAERFRVRNAVT
ncbi:MAG: kynureninase [Acidimicrobiaceae bacterium]|nr:kynureninase [Acidimicrobiaceae bacterium]